MPAADLQRFRELVFKDSTLQKRLREAPGYKSFINLVLQLGAERGCHFSAEDVRAEADANRKRWLERWK
jgi:hypothetical protein